MINFQLTYSHQTTNFFSTPGTGTISDCLEVNCAQIVVANPNLMDNHQQEIADQVAKATHVIAGKLGYVIVSITSPRDKY